MVVELTSQFAETDSCIHRIELPTPFPVGPVNTYLICNGSHAVLVDCGPQTKEARQHLLAGLEQHGVRVSDLTALVLTHGHVDHVGQARWLQAQGVPIYAPLYVDTWLDQSQQWGLYRAEFFRTLYKAHGVPEDKLERTLRELDEMSLLQGSALVDVTMEYNAACPVLPDFQVLHVPGHAQHALALFNETTGALIAGDQLLPHISSNALVEPSLSAASGALASRTKSLLQYRENLQWLDGLQIAEVYPGHGQVFSGAHELILRRLEAQERRRGEFLARLRPGEPVSTYEIALDYFVRHQAQTSLIMSETLGYLDWLCADGLVEEVSCGGRSWWVRVTQE